MTKCISDTALRDLLEELQSLGSPVDLTVCEAGPNRGKLEIVQRGLVYGSQVFELEGGRTLAFMADLAVTNLSSKTIDIVEVELQWPWKNEFFQWLDPIEIKPPSRRRRQQTRLIYRLGEFEFACDEVINETLIKRRKISGGRRIEGMLLGKGGPIPVGVCNGQWLKIPLTIFTADHGEYSKTLEVVVQRSELRKNAEGKRSRIFENVDLHAELKGHSPGRCPEPTIEDNQLLSGFESNRIPTDLAVVNDLQNRRGPRPGS